MGKWIVGFIIFSLLAVAALAVVTALNAQGSDRITCGLDNAPPAYVGHGTVYCWNKDLGINSADNGNQTAEASPAAG